MDVNDYNSPFVDRPNGSDGGVYYEKIVPGNGMAKAAQILGVMAIISVFTMLIYPAFIMGALAIILAFLSKGADLHMTDKAKTGMTTGIVAVVANIALIGVVLALLFSDGVYKQEINKVCKQMYGQTFDDMLNDAMDGSFDLEYYNLPITPSVK